MEEGPEAGAALASFELSQQGKLNCGERLVAQRLRADCRHLPPRRESVRLHAEAGRLVEHREVIADDRFARRDRLVRPQRRGRRSARRRNRTARRRSSNRRPRARGW